MDIKEVLIRNYMPYAKGTIISRAIPAIDGLKPSARRILYSMWKSGLLKGDKKKSTRIVGQVMTYHPHGDASIYDTMVRLSTGNESLNVPYIESKGNFGKVWSKDMAYAASRYTEAKLAPICEEVFEGINENAVDMVDNYDNTEVEPSLLPVKFPSILVNTSNGIAVGYASNIAPFSLKGICEGTIGLLDGSIENVEQLMDVVGAPEFPTGGFIHTDKKELLKLGTTGKGTFVISGAVIVQQDRIIIKEIPYKTDVESIVDDIKAHMKDELKEVTSVKDLSDINGLSIQILLKRGCRPRQVLKKICRLTKLRMQVSFSNTVIINNQSVTLGVYDLLNEWIAFRLETVRRIYSYRTDKKAKQVHLLEAWEKVSGDISGVVESISKNNESRAKEILMSKYSLDEEQADYFLDMKIRLITQDKLQVRLNELYEARTEFTRLKDIAENEQSRKNVIKKELAEISEKYGTERKCEMTDPLDEEDTKPEEVAVDDSFVTVVITKNFCVKKLRTIRDMEAFKADESDPELCRIGCRNTEDLLVYTYAGMCYKIKVNDIDDTRGVPKEYIFSLVEKDKDDNSDIMNIVASGNYTGSFNIIYPNGRGTKVYLSKVSGKRSKYKAQFDASAGKNIWFTSEDKFFIITRAKKAAYADLELMSKLSNRAAFKVARIGDSDEIFGVQPASRVPNFDGIELERYSKGYTVKIRDVLWE